MKATLGLTLAAAALWGTGAQAVVQLTLDTGSSSWGGANSFYAGPGGTWMTTVSAIPGYTAYGAVGTVADGYVFGFANAIPTGVADYNLGPTNLSTTATPLHLVFTGLTAVPKYVAYTGGALTGYTFSPGEYLSGGTGSITMDVSTVNPVRSGADSTGNILISAFGVIVATGGPFDFGGTVFRSDMYWGDIKGMDTGYAGARPLAGLNASGEPGATATFDAYLPFDFLTSIGIRSPADAAGLVQKSDGTTLNLSLTQTLFTSDGRDPGGLTGTYTLGGTTNFDFNGDGADGYALVTYANGNWSQGNIGLTSVPEPATCLLLLSSLALLAVFRRRALNNAPMR